jgi:hypothetical protein
MKRGDLVQTYFDEGGGRCVGPNILFGIVTKDGPRSYTVMWESGLCSTFQRDGNRADPDPVKPDMLAVARKAMANVKHWNYTPWAWPLPGVARRMPKDDGAFGFVREHEVHTGVDLYCGEEQMVHAVEDGSVRLVVDFTGERVGSPWWNPTKAILIQHGRHVVLYGELRPHPEIKIGARIDRGQSLGHVLRVRKRARGKPMTMLHLELWASVGSALRNYAGANAAVAADWPLGKKRPVGLLDPTRQLELSRKF